MKNLRLVLFGLIVLLLSFCKPSQPYYTPLDKESLAQMEESLNYYSKYNNVKLDKELANKQLQGIREMLIDESLPVITQVADIDENVFTTINTLFENYIQSNEEVMMTRMFGQYDSIFAKDFIPEIKDLNFISKNNIASSDEPYNGGDVIHQGRVNRQLKFALIDKNQTLMYYHHGGGSNSDHLVFIDLENVDNCLTFLPDFDDSRDEAKKVGIRHLNLFRNEIFRGDFSHLF